MPLRDSRIQQAFLPVCTTRLRPWQTLAHGSSFARAPLSLPLPSLHRSETAAPYASTGLPLSWLPPVGGGSSSSLPSLPPCRKRLRCSSTSLRQWLSSPRSSNTTVPTFGVSFSPASIRLTRKPSRRKSNVSLPMATSFCSDRPLWRLRLSSSAHRALTSSILPPPVFKPPSAFIVGHRPERTARAATQSLVPCGKPIVQLATSGHPPSSYR